MGVPQLGQLPGFVIPTDRNRKVDLNAVGLVCFYHLVNFLDTAEHCKVVQCNVIFGVVAYWDFNIRPPSVVDHNQAITKIKLLQSQV